MNQQINPEPSQSQTDQSVNLSAVWNRIRNWTKPPVFDDDLEKTRKAALLNPILIGAEIVFTIYSLSLFFTSENILVPIIIFPLIQVLSLIHI